MRLNLDLWKKMDQQINPLPPFPKKSDATSQVILSRVKTIRVVYLYYSAPRSIQIITTLSISSRKENGKNSPIISSVSSRWMLGLVQNCQTMVSSSLDPILSSHYPCSS